LIEQNQLKADQRLEVIHAWREHGGLEIPDDSFSGDTTSLLRGMVFGGLDMRPSAFKETTQLIEAAAFSEQEIKQLVTYSLGSEIIPAETAQWLDWLENNRWAKTLSESWQTSLMLDSRSLPHVGKWWLKREGDPRRRGVLENCCRTIYDSARKEWIEIVKARPPGEERQFLLKSIRDGWRTDSPEEEAIRLKFVKENGLQ
jgi:hypothetical protein